MGKRANIGIKGCDRVKAASMQTQEATEGHRDLLPVKIPNIIQILKNDSDI